MTTEKSTSLLRPLAPNASTKQTALSENAGEMEGDDESHSGIVGVRRVTIQKKKT